MLSFSELNSIRNFFSKEDFREMIDSYKEAYEPPVEDDIIAGMERALSVYDTLPNGFLYWVYITAIMEDIIEDYDGYHSDDYADTLSDEIYNEFGFRADNKMELLATARLRAIMTSPSAEGTELRDSAEYTFEKFRSGVAVWDEIELATSLIDEMWREF